MDFLHAIFEEQLELIRDEKGNAVIGGTVFTPVSILKADGDAYDDEFSKWLSERWLPEQNDRLGQIMEVSSNNKRFADLCLALKNGQVVPLIGSGMSVPSGLLSWSNLLRSIRCHSSMDEAELERMITDSAFEKAVERLRQAMPRRLFDEQVEHHLLIDRSKIDGPIQLLPELFDKLILTTNLDDLLEQLYEDRKLKFSHVLAGNEIGNYRKLKASSERVLLKLHGDCRSRDSRVLSEAEYKKAYANGSLIREELSMIYRTNSLLCIGCSLGPDRTVSLLSEVAKTDEGMPRHYAFLQMPEDVSILSREHFLTERDIFPIWYIGDHDECIQALFVGMLQNLGKI
jgi:hypothetical protein